MGNQLSNKAPSRGVIHHVGMYGFPHHATNVLCSDGVRRYARVTSDADTFFSMPASVKVKGKTVSGFLTANEDDEGNPDIKFIAYSYGKNGNLLP